MEKPGRDNIYSVLFIFIIIIFVSVVFTENESWHWDRKNGVEREGSYAVIGMQTLYDDANVIIKIIYTLFLEKSHNMYVILLGGDGWFRR